MLEVKPWHYPELVHHLQKPVVLLDCEASSLDCEQSYPISIGWVSLDPLSSEQEGYQIINPQTVDGWTDWSSSSEAIHRLPRAYLYEDGSDVIAVAQWLSAALDGHLVVVDSPYDIYWLSRLYAACPMFKASFEFVIDVDLLKAAYVHQLMSLRLNDTLPVTHNALQDARDAAVRLKQLPVSLFRRVPARVVRLNASGYQVIDQSFNMD